MFYGAWRAELIRTHYFPAAAVGLDHWRILKFVLHSA